jgi:anti-sigma factor ChrR (cupin superfamily)
MVATTPHAPKHEGLDALASRYVEVDALPWQPSRFPGIEIKVLMEDKESGLLTALTRFAPGAVLPLHQHLDLEQSWVLDGSLVDDEGEARSGDYVWRPAGSRHAAHSPGGALVLSFFLRPNRFLEQE